MDFCGSGGWRRGKRGLRYYINNLDISRKDFLVAGDAWKLCRSGVKPQRLFGVHSIGVWGIWFIRASLLRDLAALNKRELLPWDYTDYSHKFVSNARELGEDEIRLMDYLANLTSDAGNKFEEIKSFYKQYPQAQAGREVKSYSSETPVWVLLR